ncbi:MAG: hypothetical protein KTR16_14935 [Acidiferrobacterales bacterium]|nr:hypothetical protein [Acidiferrobacterales bacterium]
MCSINMLVTFIVVLMMSACVQPGIVKNFDYSVSEGIRANQLGYIDGYTKKFSVANTQASQFNLLDESK